MSKSEDSLSVLRNIPRGKPKSGRVWKSPKTRFSALSTDKTQKSSWAAKMKQRADKKSIKDYERQLKEERTRKLQEKRQRQEENKQRRLENERKAELVQNITNTAKLRRMKKKHLRNIQKR